MRSRARHSHVPHECRTIGKEGTQRLKIPVKWQERHTQLPLAYVKVKSACKEVTFQLTCLPSVWQRIVSRQMPVVGIIIESQNVRCLADSATRSFRARESECTHDRGPRRKELAASSAGVLGGPWPCTKSSDRNDTESWLRSRADGWNDVLSPDLEEGVKL